MQYRNITIEKEVHEKLKEYCDKKGIKIKYFISRAAEEKMKRDKK